MWDLRVSRNDTRRVRMKRNGIRQKGGKEETWQCWEGEPLDQGWPNHSPRAKSIGCYCQ